MHDVKQRLVDELMITFVSGETVDCNYLNLTDFSQSFKNLQRPGSGRSQPADSTDPIGFLVSM